MTALAVPFYLKWSRDELERQIDKMQAAVHGTPGAEAPVPSAVLLGSVGLIGGHWLLAKLLGMKSWQTFLSLLAAIGAGFGFYHYGASGNRRQT